MKSKTREWDIRSSGSELLRLERAEWERCVNQSLEQANRIERVDCRSHAEKQTGLEPQVHLGPTAMAMERKGVQTERGDEHRRIRAHNERVIALSQVRAQQDKESAWLQELQRYEALSVPELEKVAKQYEPCVARYLAFQDPDVQAAYAPLKSYDPYAWFGRGYTWEEPREEREDYEAGRFGWLDERKLAEREKAVESSRRSLLWAQREEDTFREAHPVKAALFDLGLPNAELKALTEQRAKAQAQCEQSESALSEFVQARAEAQEKLEEAIQKALPQAEKALPERQARFADIQAILEPKREAAREQARQREQERARERGGGGRSIDM